MGAIDILNCDFEVGEILGISSANRFSCFEKKEFNNNTLTKHIKFVYDGFKLIAEFDVLNSDEMLRSYAWSNTDLDTPMWMKSADNNYYYQLDGNKNVVGLVDEMGATANHYEYTPFGKLSTDNETIAQPFKFSSEYHDTETGLIYYNFRYYNPTHGKWLKRDPIAEQGGLNLYGFVRNNSVSSFDELGLWKPKRLGGSWSFMNNYSNVIYEAEHDGESLEQLAVKVGMKEENWQCIWPVCFSGDKNDYPSGIKKGDQFDVSNLVVKKGGSLSAGLKNRAHPNKYANIQNNAEKSFLNLTFLTPSQIINKIKKDSGQGKSPLAFFLLKGHGFAGEHYMKGALGQFHIDDLILYAEVMEGYQDYTHAKKKIGPPRCWFTKNAKVYASGCRTGVSAKGQPSFAEYFADNFLRDGASAYGTTNFQINKFDYSRNIFSGKIQGATQIKLGVDGALASSRNEYLNSVIIFNQFGGQL